MAPPLLLGPGFIPPEGLFLGPLDLKNRYLIVFQTFFSKLLYNKERKFSPKKEYYFFNEPRPGGKFSLEMPT